MNALTTFIPPRKFVRREEAAVRRLVLQIMKKVINDGSYKLRIKSPEKPCTAASFLAYASDGVYFGFQTHYDVSSDEIVLLISYENYEKMKLSELETYKKLQTDINHLVEVFDITPDLINLTD